MQNLMVEEGSPRAQDLEGHQGLETLVHAEQRATTAPLPSSVIKQQNRSNRMTKSEAGRLGGQATAKKHGTAHMKAIGRRGADATWAKYNLVPVGTSQYAMVDKQTNEIKAIF